MARISIKLDLLERVVAAPGKRELAEASVAAFKDVVRADHFSVILFDTTKNRAEDYFLNEAWLAADNLFWQDAQQKLANNPMAKSLLSKHQSTALVRSKLIPDAVWKRTWVYNEVERPLEVEDLATVYQVISPQEVMVLSCGRRKKFSDGDLPLIQGFHRVLNGLVLSRGGASVCAANPSGGRSPGKAIGLLDALTAREGEILHWVRAGKTDSEIGTILGISHRTVNHHLESIYRKLGVENRTAAAGVRLLRFDGH